MSVPPNIRPLRPSDLKIVRYQIGSSLMAPLATANKRAYVHPLTVAVWVALSSIMVQILNWWPTTQGPIGIWGMLAPLPALAAVAVPIMFFFDWLHRPAFEQALQKALTAPDMHDPLTHYSRSPASGFYVLENNDAPIGLIALDASAPPSSDVRSSKTKTKTNTKASMGAETAIIRHFFVEQRYRASGVQSDLLEHAVSRAFQANSSPRLHRVRTVSRELESYKMAALRAAKFRPPSHWDSEEPQAWKIGVYGWWNRWVEVTLEEWQAKK